MPNSPPHDWARKPRGGKRDLRSGGPPKSIPERRCGRPPGRLNPHRSRVFAASSLTLAGSARIISPGPVSTAAEDRDGLPNASRVTARSRPPWNAPWTRCGRTGRLSSFRRPRAPSPRCPGAGPAAELAAADLEPVVRGGREAAQRPRRQPYRVARRGGCVRPRPPAERSPACSSRRRLPARLASRGLPGRRTACVAGALGLQDDKN
jgi:hypothetical protein